jgi:AmmeMemoRadiSam system protein B/AmmeMemoRadiSam system protein A
MVKTNNFIGNGLACIVCLLGLATGCSQIGDLQNSVKQPVAAGKYYPKDNAELNKLLKKAFQTAPPPKLRGSLRALLIPDAPYRYTGILSAMAIKSLRVKKIDTVYIIGQAKRASVTGALVWQGRAWRTPLGLMAVDRESVNKLLQHSNDINFFNPAWADEYAVEMQLPFLQTILPEAKIVPIMMGAANWEECWSVATAIARQAENQQAVIIISSNMSVFTSQDHAEKIDKKILDAMKELDVYQIDRLASQFEAEGIAGLEQAFAGLASLKTGLISANLLGANRAELIQYTNQGQLTGKSERVAGYGVVAFLDDPQIAPHTIKRAFPNRQPINLSKQEQLELLRIARASIKEAMATGRALDATTNKASLLVKHPVYIKLIKNGDMRGTYGLIDGGLPLYQAIAEIAPAAAFRDTRFSPVSMDELPYLDIEIVILTNMTPITEIDQIQLSERGFIVKRGNRQGITLPAEMMNKAWTKEQMLEDLCANKAGLARDAWRDQRTKLYSFEVVTIREDASDLPR